MADNILTLFCLVDGEAISKAFSVKIQSVDTVDDLKDLIKAKKTNNLHDVDANELTLWNVSVPTAYQTRPFLIDTLDKNKLDNPRARLSNLFPESPDENTYIIVQRPPPELDLPSNKKIRITEGWGQYTASDGKVVDLPPLWIDILASTEFVPEPRTAFDRLKNDLRAGDAIDIPSMGQTPKDFGLQGRKLFVTEQMLELWEDMCGDRERTYRRVLSGPMGVGKSYLSYFLAARAYAEGWLVLYVSDAGLLATATEDKSALEVVKRFLALNKDILTAAQLEMLVDDSTGTRDILIKAAWLIFTALPMQSERRTLLVVDEHGKLFQDRQPLPERFTYLNPLSDFHWWGEDAKGSRVIFTGTAHAKYEMTVLDQSYRLTSVVFVGPLSDAVFLKLLDTYPRLNQPKIKHGVKTITNCVPRELVYLSAFLERVPGLISEDHLQDFSGDRAKFFLHVAGKYYNGLPATGKKKFYNALLQTFLFNTTSVDFDWEFVD
ncbi:hypothetical protein BG006_002359 [Podila minutissima]|uniref:Crinkler effector protein N-terminal domain-containing protein n=1 Tax=Podila minutissima TaxID=64525 RepID=A0A9P5VGS0_9FUNG|nr:hypothetical protein BG006_002359 [Podila minutissima]